MKTLIQSVVISRLDYCNCIFVGMPLNSIRKLHLAHNAAARVVQEPLPRAHMTPILRQLHWLPVMKRCQFKLLTITFKSLHDDAPEYIQNLVNRYYPRKQLRSVNDTLLTPNRNRTVKYGRRLMDTAAASLWNTLPIGIKNALNIVSFKKMLKTHLFYFFYSTLIICIHIYFILLLLISKHFLKTCKQMFYKMSSVSSKNVKTNL